MPHLSNPRHPNKGITLYVYCHHNQKRTFSVCVHMCYMYVDIYAIYTYVHMLYTYIHITHICYIYIYVYIHAYTHMCVLYIYSCYYSLWQTRMISITLTEISVFTIAL